MREAISACCVLADQDVVVARRMFACRRTAAWRQRMLEKACRPALGDLGREPQAAHASSPLDDGYAFPRRDTHSRAGLLARGGTRGQQSDDCRLKTVAWDTHCIGSMLAGARLC